MIVDSMSKVEVLEALQKDFLIEAKPYFDKQWIVVRQSMRERSLRTKQSVRRGLHFISKNNLNYFAEFIYKNINDIRFVFTAEFYWNSRRCYASFFEENMVVVYQSHCIERYIERVLQGGSDNIKQVFYKLINRHQYSAFCIVLPTPTHKYSVYFGLDNALFLGDFDPGVISSTVQGKWFNTCISLKEAGNTQSRLLQTLLFLQSFVQKLGYNPIDTGGLSPRDKKRIEQDLLLTQWVIDFYKKSYLLLKLHLQFEFPFTQQEIHKIEETMAFLISELSSYNISVKQLSPYDSIEGVAIKGEIDYKGIRR